ncbi:MAG: PHB depolymerase family esterase [Candidatus Competibacter denitrificans]
MPKGLSVLASLLLVGIFALPNPINATGTAAERVDFGANPGQLRLFFYRPDTLRAPAALVVALHGCQQTALEYARLTGWLQQADRWGFLLLLPEQRLLNNPQRCFNWFRPAQVTRDQGEAGSIRQMIARLQTEFPIDSQRIYVAGLSAGGAMAAALLAVYPDVFAGGASIAGVPYGCASGMLGALYCQSWGRDLRPAEWAEKVRHTAAEANLHPQRWPILSIWQGQSDWVVDSTNARELAEQWSTLHGLESTAASEETGQGYSHRVYRDATGQPRVESYLIAAMGHGQPIDPGSNAAQCGTAADYVLPVGICASERIIHFWGLAP